MKKRPVKEAIVENMILVCAVAGSLIIFFVMFFILSRGLPVLQASGPSFFTAGGWDKTFSISWSAAPGKTNWRYGAVELIAGTVLTSAGALLLAALLGMGCAVFLTEYCPVRLRRPVEGAVRLLAGVPPVIYGVVGLTVVVPLVKSLISNDLAKQMVKICVLDGTSMLAGIIVLGVMITPTFVILATDALDAVPPGYRFASLALGVSHWRTIVKIIIPAARRGIMAAGILAAGVAVGEFIAMAMVAGGVAFLPNPAHGLVFFLEPVRTLAASIFVNNEVLGRKDMESALFACASVILFICIALSLLAQLINRADLKGGRSG
ncbi:MAG: Phosphate transport system permease protein PstC [Pelotomaculum sp. PtaU1.Bin035]|nr:MAG: Phosphate transport system permease protein PstC [Pelotomaculum sp. PtaU1.Bin035]